MRALPANYPLLLLAVFGSVLLALGIKPLYRQDWLLENLLVLVGVSVLVLTYGRFRFSNRAYTYLCLFLLLHEIGAHYTYSEVPVERWVESLTGDWLENPLDWQRNHYDRLIHFAYGLLMLRPAVELLQRVAPSHGSWARVLPILFILSHSAIYELVEWLAAMVFGGDLGIAYLGTQGDEWDAQKDMACAAAGAFVATAWMAGSPHLTGGSGAKASSGR